MNKHFDKITLQEIEEIEKKHKEEEEELNSLEVSNEVLAALQEAMESN